MLNHAKYLASFLLLTQAACGLIGTEEASSAAQSDDDEDSVYCKGMLLTGTPFAAGTGTADEPYQICTFDQLNNMRDDIEAHYELKADIDASASAELNAGEGWEPIGSAGTPFVGSLNGNGHAISGLFIDRPADDYMGFFGGVSNAVSETTVLSDLTFVDASIEGRDNVGVISAFADPAEGDVPLIEDIIVNGGTVTGRHRIGGLIGTSDDGSGGVALLAERTLSSAAVVSAGANAGGLVGYLYGSILRECIASGTVQAASFSGIVAGYVAGTVTADVYLDRVYSTETEITGCAGGFCNSDCDDGDGNFRCGIYEESGG